MTRAEIHDRLTDVFRDVFDDDAIEIVDETTADDVEAWDSLTHVNLIVAAEKTFAVKFTTKEVLRLANVGELITLIASKVS